MPASSPPASPASSRFTVVSTSALATAQSMPARSQAGAAGVASADGGPPVARPLRWIGAEPAGGLALPSATPTAGHLYAPRAVWLDDERLVVADTGNHRVLIWHGPPGDDHADADVVLGQADAGREGAQADGRGPERGMRLPTGVLVHEGRLVVADAWNHRLLVWDAVPQRTDVAPDVVIGQPDAAAVDENRGGACGPLGLWWPFGIAVVAGRLHVADTGNRRVLAWHGIPEPDVEPDVVIGQPDARRRDENRGELGPASFRWPHDVAGTADRLLVADAGNHRVLGWSPPPAADVPADQVLGQADFVTGSEFPYAPQTRTSLRFPYAVAVGAPAEGAPGVPAPGGVPVRDGRLVVADTANNRVLVWDEVPAASTAPADHVIGQPDFALNGENRWDQVAADTLCWPYGLCLHGDRLAVADSGNNRVVIWAVER